LEEAGFELINKDGLRMMWNPDQEAIASCTAFGKEIGSALAD